MTHKPVLVTIVLLIVAIAACDGGATSSPTSTPAPVPTPENQLEESLVAFMLDYVAENEIEAMIDFIETEGLPLIESPPEAFIIVWSSTFEEQGDYPWEWLDTERPNRVWLYNDGDQKIQEDKRRAIENYQQKYIETSPASPSIFQWGYYEFGILSISEEQQEAEVYLHATCGSLCGHGILFTLKLNSDGMWEIVDQEGLWVS
jgi:hypothetical protein